MRFIVRHPIFIISLFVIAGLSYLVFDRLQQQPGAGGMSGGPGQRPGMGGPGDAAIVQVEPVSHQSIADQVESIGTAVANESVNLAAKVSETVSRIHFEDGEFVEAGTVLVELTNATETTRLAEAQAGTDDARRQLERMENLEKSSLVADNDVDQARTNLQTSAARLDGVMVAMDDRLIRAPFSGLLGFRNISEGSLLSPGTIITTLDDISLIKLDFSISETYLADVKTGQTITAKSIVYPDRDFDGTIRVVGTRVDPVTRSVAVRAHIANPDFTLRPGMLLTVKLALNEHEATIVPELSVVSASGKHHVFVVDEQNIARQVEVSLGRRRPGVVEVTSGVNPGQRVVTEGLTMVRPDRPVQILRADRTAAPTSQPDRS